MYYMYNAIFKLDMPLRTIIATLVQSLFVILNIDQ